MTHEFDGLAMANRNSRSLSAAPFSAFALGLALLPIFVVGCKQNRGRSRTEAITQAIAESKTKTDNLRKAMRYLGQVTQVNRPQTTKEVQLELNTWIQTIDQAAGYSPSRMLDALPQPLLAEVGCASPLLLQFSYWDVDYLYECRLMNKLSSWIVNFPLRDSLINAAIEAKSATLDEQQMLKLGEACKLFDWVTRNIVLQAQGSDVTQLLEDPVGPLSDEGIGYTYLPWQTLLFSMGDVVERGRIFSALARQRGIDTGWISVKPTDGGPPKIWCMCAIIGDEILLFEPKLGLPILNSDTREFANLEETQKNTRILRRLDLPGQFDYALDAGELQEFEILLDVPPVAASARMKLLQASLLSDERMNTYYDLAAGEKAFQERLPEGTKVRLWEIPAMAQVYAQAINELLKTQTEKSQAYRTRHFVWLADTPASQGRFQHLFGNFENGDEALGALAQYMDARTDNESIQKLEYDPDVQKELGVQKNPNETMEQYANKIRIYQDVFRKSKIDASFLLAQLHFDRGNYEASEKWFQNRVVDPDNLAAAGWQAQSHYCLGRIYQEQGNLEKVREEFSYQPDPRRPESAMPNTIEAGCRLRLRYVRAMLEEQQADAGGEADTSQDASGEQPGE